MSTEVTAPESTPVPELSLLPEATIPALDLSKDPETLEQAKAHIAALRASGGNVPEWAQRRIDQLTGNWRETERGFEALKAQLAAKDTQIAELRTAGKTVVAPDQGVIEARAAQLAEDRIYNQATEAVVNTGMAAFPDFAASIQRLHGVSPLLIQGVPNMPRGFIEAVIELDKPETILQELAKPANLDEVAKIMGMTGAKQGLALAKFALRAAPTPQAVSKLDPPSRTTVTGASVAGPVDLYNSKVDTKTWIEERNKQLAGKRGRR